MPQIDERVKSKGSSWLRNLNSNSLTEMAFEDNVYIVRDADQQPVMVLVPYLIYLQLQDQKRGD